MTRVVFGPGIPGDFGRILDHLVEHEAGAADARVLDIVQALDVLERNPLIGRPVADGKRELVIGRGPRGYVALYRYLPDMDTAFVLALRAQREAGFAERND